MTIADKINFAIAAIGLLSLVVSLAVAVVSYKAVQANRAAVEVMRAQLEATTRPYILIAPFIRPMSTFIQLRISNTGSSSARNLRLSLDKDYFFNAEEDASQNLRHFAAFTHPIVEFPPGAELVFHLGVGHRILKSDLTPLRFTVSANYEYSGREIHEPSTVDLQPLMNAGMPIDPVAERLETIKSAIDKLASIVERRDS